ncbi:MAG: SusD/RagB family lipoprotein [Mucilaginibacter sp.]|nr:SusD/RagB family lipoprotein [Mucilaginibacter sp.]
MKPIKNLFIFFLVLLSACNKNALNVIPKNSLSDVIFWKTQEDANLALAGCYNSWETYMNICFLDAVSDNGYEQFDYGYQQKGNGQITPANFQQSSWPDKGACNWFTYSRIRKYNNFLTKIATVQMDANKKEVYKAEVRFLRAYDYFNKVMFFGDIPVVKELVTSDVKLKRNAAAEVQQFILDELTAISAILPVQNNIESGGHITKGAALALKARLELYLGKYTEAMQDSKAVIDMPVYQLYPNYRDLFLPENKLNNRESILEIEYLKDGYQNMLPQLSLPALDLGWSALSASKSMVDAYECSNGKLISDPASGYNPDKPFANRDPRLDMTIIYPGQFWNGRYYNSLDKLLPNGNKNPDYHEEAAASRGGQNVKKYVKPMSLQDMNNNDGNIMVIRLAEMYLTFAECAVATGQNTGLGLQYIQDLRTRAGQTNPPGMQLTMDLVRRERRVELAFEGLRFFDVKRWDLGPSVLPGPLYGSREGTVDPVSGQVTWAAGYIKLEDRQFNPVRNYLLPIPQSEMDSNPAMTQNPGY